jgi:hypothetical protein
MTLRRQLTWRGSERGCWLDGTHQESRLRLLVVLLQLDTAASENIHSENLGMCGPSFLTLLLLLGDQAKVANLLSGCRLEGSTGSY